MPRVQQLLLTVLRKANLVRTVDLMDTKVSWRQAVAIEVRGPHGFGSGSLFKIPWFRIRFQHLDCSYEKIKRGKVINSY